MRRAIPCLSSRRPAALAALALAGVLSAGVTPAVCLADSADPDQGAQSIQPAAGSPADSGITAGPAGAPGDVAGRGDFGGETPEGLPGMKGGADGAQGAGGMRDAGGMQGGPSVGQGGGAAPSSSDPEVLAALEEAAPKFAQFTYVDEQTGIELAYSLFVPAGAETETEAAPDAGAETEAAQTYPLIMFIPDATGAGKTPEQLVEQYFGAAIWATDAEQAKHPCFVLVPAFSEVVVDDNWNTSEQIEAAARLIGELCATYPVDADRLYTTGQSMGCMTSLYLNATQPDLFAASLFVSGQWDIDVLQPLEDATFFYITAGGDAKASGGQDEVMALFDTDGVPYSWGTWSAQNDADEQNAAVEELLAEGAAANMVRFEAGTVGASGNSEHNASFVYGYKIEAVRDWLFQQSKAEQE